ncbi:MAG: hypothetical protein HON14_03315 [Rhodospirillaceae bacterium]|jgi:hypothetical protein|nr:hypothetical protein [Rhodospirillaceae bacterium]MBT4938136.1 hypothetical protein [Rhodospirillaceae bacterium]MBT5939806.1 hypothetical protein [Rhodospirillaceae bacterium]MBT7266031.1 hypothetical protein [Rhodospirillaceae bacterium]
MFIRSLFILIAASGLLLGSLSLTAAPKFVPGINDLPLMPGLALRSDAPVVFDTPGGRIVEVFAEGRIPKARIRAFYGSTLPELGWKPYAASQFQRDKELLKIEITEAANGTTMVRYSVVPKGQ